MEDFGSILWTVVLIGFAIFSVVAKGREKGTKQQPKEAWPSWDTDSDAENSQVDEDADDISEHKPNRTLIYGSPENSDSYEAAAFPEEAQSLEEIPEHEYTSFEESGTALSGTLNPHTATQVSGRNAFVDTQSAATEYGLPTNNTSKFQAKPAKTAGNAILEEDIDEPTIDFDLRKAVIYSEMLKPKFDE